GPREVHEECRVDEGPEGLGTENDHRRPCGEQPGGARGGKREARGNHREEPETGHAHGDLLEKSPRQLLFGNSPCTAMQKLSVRSGCMLLCGWSPPAGPIALGLIATTDGAALKKRFPLAGRLSVALVGSATPPSGKSWAPMPWLWAGI